MSYREPMPEEMHMPRLLAGMTDAFVPDVNVRGMALDSRQVIEGAMFLACRGSQTHGLEFWPQAEAKGAAVLVWEPQDDLQPPETQVPTVAVENLSQQVAEIAARFYGHPSEQLFVVGITGTDGKTSSAWLLAQACKQLGEDCGYLGTLGYGLPDALEAASHTTPDPVRLQYWLARLRASGATAVAMEVSSHALDQGRANGVAFDIAMLTNLGRDHLDYHGDLESYVAAKRRLFEVDGLAKAVLNGDDETARGWIDGLSPQIEVTLFGFSDELAHKGKPYVRGQAVNCTARGIELDIVSSWGAAHLQSPLLGRFNAANLLACLAILLQRGVELPQAVAALEAATAVPGRMEALVSTAQQPMVVVDYAHTPQALRQALLAARAHAEGRVLCVFGCGGDRDRGKRPLMGRVADELADMLIITDDNPRSENPADIVTEIVAGCASGEYVIEHNRAQAIVRAIGAARAGDVVLIAGKGHEDYQLVGDERLPFDDRQYAAAVLAGREDAGSLH